MKIPSDERDGEVNATEMNEEGKKKKKKERKSWIFNEPREKSILSSGRRNLISVRTPFN